MPAKASLLAAAAALLAAPALVQGQGQCFHDAQCQFQTNYHGTTITYDLRRLCNAAQDYRVQDADGRNYNIQICGIAAQNCLPASYQVEYMQGTVVQSWGSTPACTTKACVNSQTMQDACCTSDCEVVAVGQPSFSLLDPNNLNAGIQLTYLGDAPTGSDKYICDYDPNTGAPFPRVTHLQFTCDEDVTGFAQVDSAAVNPDDGCEYFIRIRTNAVCLDQVEPSLSGGWVFVIIALVVFSFYAIAGSLWTYYTTKACRFPHRAFWLEAESLIFDGVLFVARGFKKHKRLPTAAGGASKGFGSSDAAPLFSGSSSSAAAAGGSGSSSGSGYQNVGGSSQVTAGGETE